MATAQTSQSAPASQPQDSELRAAWHAVVRDLRDLDPRAQPDLAGLAERIDTLAQRMLPGEPRWAGELWALWGETLWQRRQDEAALTAYRQASRVFRDLGDDCRVARIGMQLAALNQRLGRLDAADRMFAQLEPRLQACADQRNLVILGLNRGGLLLSRGRPQDALAQIERILAVAQALPDRHPVALLQMNRGLALTELGRPREALAAFAGAAPLFLELKDDLNLALSHQNCADALRTLGEHDAAMGHLDTAEELLRAAGDAPRVAAVQVNRGIVLHAMGRPEAALGEYRRAEPALRRLREPAHRLPVMLAGQGTALATLGRYEDALRRFDEAQRMFEQQQDHVRLAQTRIEIAGVLARLRRDEDALAALEQAHAVLKPLGTHDSLRVIATNRASILLTLGRTEAARQAVTEALEMLMPAGTTAARAVAALLRCQLARLEGRHEEELAASVEARQHLQAAGDRRGANEARWKQANALHALGRTTDALEHYSQLIDVFTRDDDSLNLAHLELNRGRILVQAGDDRRALAAFTASAIHLERGLVGQVQRLGDETSEAWRGTFDGLLQMLLACQEHLGITTDPAHAYRVLQTLHGMGTASLLAERGTMSAARLPQQLRERFADLHAQLTRAIRDRDAAADPSRSEQAARAVRTLDAELALLTDQARRQCPGYADFNYPQPAALAEVQAQLPAGVALIEYQIHDRDGAWAAVTTASSCRMVRLGDAAAIREEAGLLYEALRAAGAPRPAPDLLRALGRRVLDPVLAALSKAPIHTLLVSPHGALCRIPLDVLCTANVTRDSPVATWPLLLQRFDVAYVHSGTALVTQRRQRTRRGAVRHELEFAGLGFPFAREPSDPPDALAGLRQRPRAALPGSAEEVLRAARLFATSDQERARLDQGIAAVVAGHPLPEERILGPRFAALLQHAADEASLKTSAPLRAARILHLACHGELDGTSPRSSRLVLAREQAPAEGDAEDGLLFLRELLNLDLDCELLLLSACSSNPGVLSRVEGMTGMARAGLAAGAQAVLSTLWQVDDRHGRDLVLAFLANVAREGMTRVRACGSARRQALAAMAPWSTWSAYVLWDCP